MTTPKSAASPKGRVGEGSLLAISVRNEANFSIDSTRVQWCCRIMRGRSSVKRSGSCSYPSTLQPKVFGISPYSPRHSVLLVCAWDVIDKTSPLSLTTPTAVFVRGMRSATSPEYRINRGSLPRLPATPMLSRASISYRPSPDQDCQNIEEKNCFGSSR